MTNVTINNGTSKEFRNECKHLPSKHEQIVQEMLDEKAQLENELIQVEEDHLELLEKHILGKLCIYI